MIDAIWSPAFLGAAGGLLEILGLAKIVRRSRRELRVQHGEPGALRRLGAWVRHQFEAPTTPVSKTIRVNYAIDNADAGETTLLIGETDIERLQRQLNKLTARVTAHEAQTKAGLDETRRRFADNFNDLSGRLNNLVAGGSAARRDDLRAEVTGAWLFAAGALLSALANVA